MEISDLRMKQKVFCSSVRKTKRKRKKGKEEYEEGREEEEGESLHPI